jgi:hypothetical protein
VFGVENNYIICTSEFGNFLFGHSKIVNNMLLEFRNLFSTFF